MHTPQNHIRFTSRVHIFRSKIPRTFGWDAVARLHGLSRGISLRTERAKLWAKWRLIKAIKRKPPHTWNCVFPHKIPCSSGAGDASVLFSAREYWARVCVPFVRSVGRTFIQKFSLNRWWHIAAPFFLRRVGVSLGEILNACRGLHRCHVSFWGNGNVLVCRQHFGGWHGGMRIRGRSNRYVPFLLLFFYYVLLLKVIERAR